MDGQVANVVAAGNCSGCGACVLFGAAAGMRLDPAGDLRPFGSGPGPRLPLASYCPGVAVARPAASRQAVIDPDFGPALGVWIGWAGDPDLRFEGSSGGALSALSRYLLHSGEAAEVAAVAAAGGTRSTGTVIGDVGDVASCASSRYAPASSLAALGPRPELPPELAVVGKPCEAAALRSATGDDPQRPTILSFFCAGVPSQAATDALVADLGMNPDEVQALRYRGRGWPGMFRASDEQGNAVQTTYEGSWGDHLGKRLQSRCKVCIDGVGESADVVAGDIWACDDNGYPLFDDAPGQSVIIARTQRGLDLVRRAAAAGFLEITPTDFEQLRTVQRYQVERRAAVPGRLAGRRLAGLPVPRYRGFGLIRLTLRNPLHNLRQARGSFRRARQ